MELASRLKSTLERTALLVSDTTLLLDHFLSCVVFPVSSVEPGIPKDPIPTFAGSTFLQSMTRLILAVSPQ